MPKKYQIIALLSGQMYMTKSNWLHYKSHPSSKIITGE